MHLDMQINMMHKKFSALYHRLFQAGVRIFHVFFLWPYDLENEVEAVSIKGFHRVGEIKLHHNRSC